MTAELEYLGELRTLARHQHSGSLIETDAPLDNQGRAERFSPTDLVATALVSCMFTIMGISAREYGISLEGMKARMKKIMYADPRRIGEIHIDIFYPDRGPSLSDRDKKILRQAALGCPVKYSLHPEIQIHLEFHEAPKAG